MTREYPEGTVLLPSKSSLEMRAANLEVISVALEIIEEFEIYRWHRDQITLHIKTQRKIVNSRRKFFLEALELRDGTTCLLCAS